MKGSAVVGWHEELLRQIRVRQEIATARLEVVAVQHHRRLVDDMRTIYEELRGAGFKLPF